MRASPRWCNAGWQAAWLAYFRSMQENGFDADTPIYVASGLLTYLNTAGVLPHSLMHK